MFVLFCGILNFKRDRARDLSVDVEPDAMRARVEQSSERQDELRCVCIGASLVSGAVESRAHIAPVQSHAINRQAMNVVAINYNCRNTHRSVETRNHFECAQVRGTAWPVAEHKTHSVNAIRKAGWNRDRLVRVSAAGSNARLSWLVQGLQISLPPVA